MFAKICGFSFTSYLLSSLNLLIIVLIFAFIESIYLNVQTFSLNDYLFHEIAFIHLLNHSPFLLCRSALVTSLPLDLGDLNNVAKCVDKLQAFLGTKKIDVLVNNAGIMALPTREVA